MHRQNLFIYAFQRFDRQHDSTADRQHDFDKAAPAAAVWWPPAKLPAIPGGDARFVQRRVKVNSALKSLRDAARIFGHQLGELRAEVSTFDPVRQPVMDQVNDWVDTECQQVFECLIGPTPIPNTACRVNFVPRNSIPGYAHAQAGHQIQVQMPALIVLGELVFIQRAARLRPRISDKSVLDTRSPQERSPFRQAARL